MNKSIVLFFLLVWLVGCNPTDVTKSLPSITPEPNLKPTIEPTTEPINQPVTTNFGGKSIYTQLQFDDVETGVLLPGFEFGEYGDAIVITDPDQIIDGKYSIRLSQYGHIKSNPDVLPLEGDSTYLVEFDYKILDRGNESENIMYFVFHPVGENSGRQDFLISTFDMLKNADVQGTFTTSAKTGNESSYQLSISTTEKASVVIDNIRVLHQGTQKFDQLPKYWENISTLPYPRLGNYMQGSIPGISWGIGGEPPGTYSVNQLIEKFSMYDIIFGVDIRNQTFDPGFAYELRKRNPNLILLPYLGLDGQNLGPDSEHIYGDGSVDIYHNFASGISDKWIMRDTEDNPVEIKDWGGCCFMNISEYSPIVNGKTYNGYVVDWITGTILPSGEWDGVFFDNLFGRVSFYIKNNTDPAAFDFDFNLNGLRDETPALVSEMYRRSSILFLENLRKDMGESGIIMGNTGSLPEIFLAPYVNGYSFECVDEAWDAEWLPYPSEAGWRKVLDSYLIMEKNSMTPTINVFEGCGRVGDYIEPDHIYLTPTEEDIRAHRFTLGTTLLANGFYEYDLFDARSAPYWFDEFTVDSNGLAVEDPQYKGYLGFALGDAIELKLPAALIWDEDFEQCIMSLEAGDPRIYISRESDDLISGNCSLVIDIPDHTKQAEIAAQIDPSQVNFNPGETYLVAFDWRILETIDGDVESTLWIGDIEFTVYGIPGNVKGDSGTAFFPFTLPDGDNFSLRFLLGSGGGKVAFDNIKITEGGVGPWRRDFENGFVLVNPINRPYTFSREELTGPFNRTGIKRILGTQASGVNNGKFVTGSLTLEPFDAIILLADTIPTE